MKILLNIVILLAGSYLLILGYLYLKQDAFIYFPAKIPSHNRFIIERYDNASISLSITDVTLRGWLIQRGDPLLIYFGGNAEEISGNLHDINKYNSGSLLFINYRGYGTSTGQPTAENLSSDALTIYDSMINEYGYTPDNIILIGRSLGSAIAVHLAANRDVKALILVTPFDSMVNLAKEHYPLFPINLLLKHRFDSIKHTPELNIPMLAIIGGNDRIVPAERSLSLIETWGGPQEIVTIPDADHNDISAFSEYWQAINDFIDHQYD